MRRLVLWDIDQTLVTVDRFSTGLFGVVLRALTGRELRQIPAMGGKTDRQLVLAMLESEGVTPTEPLIEAFYASFAKLAHERAEELRARGRALAGAAEALAAFSGVRGVIQSVVTGNIEPVARLKLELFGLAPHVDFEVGAYGAHSADRRDLVDLARQRASDKYGPFAANEVMVIGDTIHDIAGALSSGVRAIGVATGRTRADELVAAGAHFVVPSLQDTRAVTDFVLG